MAEWKPIKDFPGYEVSDDGRVRSVGRFVRNGAKSQRWVEPCERALQPHTSGYLQLVLWRDCKGVNCFVHILVAEAFIPNPESLPTVNHDDGDKTNNRKGNLEWATYSENHLHRTRTLGIGRGVSHSHAKLTEEQVLAIREDRRTRRIIAEEYGISRQTVDGIIWRKRWKHI